MMAKCHIGATLLLDYKYVDHQLYKHKERVICIYVGMKITKTAC